MPSFRNETALIRDWEFRRIDDGNGWRRVELPHTPFLSDLDGNDHWLGVCQYRYKLRIERPRTDERITLYFGAAMHSAVVSIDGVVVARHVGGYLPFEVDITDRIAAEQDSELLVELDNRDNPEVPPGKPLAELDFCWYGGLYREVELRRYPSLHITNAATADEEAGGGVFVRTTKVAADEAEISIRAHVCNTSGEARRFTAFVEVVHGRRIVAVDQSTEIEIAAGAAVHVDLTAVVINPKLWCPESPHLYELRVSLRDPKTGLVDQRSEKFGIRWISISRSEGLRINGKRYRPRGTNRHQDYPRLGYALSDAAQYRDAKRIKEAGFDYVRLSHYPQSPAFLDACDEMGILVMNCIPGWQHMGGDSFREASYQNAREMIRRDRNHPSVILWELSLNETEMDEAFMRRMQEIGHAEYPGGQMFTCGWMDYYDVFIHARQHGKLHNWENGDKAMVIAEYGDWEYYAANEGFDQKSGSGLLADWSNSRGFRGNGERKLRQQAKNHIAALNDTLISSAICDGVWSMFDYPRGYASVRAACGVMDLFRLPKFSYYFYRSQRRPEERGQNWNGGPMVFIASYWTQSSNLDLLVFSNCSEIEMRLNGRIIGRKRPCRTWANQRLPNPPFVFHIERFEAGELVAEGYVDGKAVASHVVATPGEPAAVEIEICDEGVSGVLEEGDVLLAHARVLDGRRQLCAESDAVVTFSITGGACVVGPTTVHAEAGIASAVIRRYAGLPQFAVAARSPGLAMGKADYRLQPGEEPWENSAIAVAQD